MVFLISSLTLEVGFHAEALRGGGGGGWGWEGSEPLELSKQ